MAAPETKRRALRYLASAVIAVALVLPASPVASAASASIQGPVQAPISAAGPAAQPARVGSAVVPPDVAAAVAAGPVSLVVGFDPAGGVAAIQRLSPSGTGAAQLTAGSAAAAAVFAAQKQAAYRSVPSGVTVQRTFSHLPVDIVRVAGAAALSALAAAPGVTSLALPVTYHKTADSDLTLIRQPVAVASGYTGAGVAVAVIDTGTDYTGPGVGNTFGNCAGGPGTGTCRIDRIVDVSGTGDLDTDPGQHGTNVSGTVARVAPAAHLDVYGVFQPGGNGATNADILTALNDIAANGPARGVRAVNMSLGDSTYNTTECTGSAYSGVFLNLRSLGILPVVAAGNAAYDTGTFVSGVSGPACASGALRVGAVYSEITGDHFWFPCTDFSPVPDQIACFSQTGPLLSLLAPGVDVTSAGVTESGTSQATPHVAGAVASVLSANPQATAAQIAAALTGTGPSITDPRDGTTVHRLDIPAAARAVQGPNGSYISLRPARILDTRSNNGATGPVPAAGQITLQVTGRGGVPTGVSAVALTVTAVTPARGGYLTTWPSGTRPGSSNLNFAAGQTVANLVIVPVGSDGKIRLYNGSPGSVQILADVAGYYLGGTPTAPGTLNTTAPNRILDTRTNTGANGPVPAAGQITLQVAGRGGVPSTGASAVALTVTAVNPAAAGYLTAWPSGTRPSASNLNFAAGQTVANLVIVPIGSDGKIRFYNGSGGAVQILADVAGYYLGGTPTATGTFQTTAPTRILDTRSNTGATGPVAAAGQITLQVTGHGGVPSTGVSAVALTVTAVTPTGAGYLTAWKSGTARPTVSNLNFAAGQTVANLVIVPVGADGKIRIFNGSTGPVQILADVAGYLR